MSFPADLLFSQPEFEGVYAKNDERFFFRGLECAQCHYQFRAALIQNQLTLTMRRFVLKVPLFDSLDGRPKSEIFLISTMRVSACAPSAASIHVK